MKLKIGIILLIIVALICAIGIAFGVGNSHVENGQYGNLNKIEDYLWAVNYTDVDWDNVPEITEICDIKNLYAGCTSFTTNGYLCRNLDYYYTQNVQFIVHMTCNDKKIVGVTALSLNDTYLSEHPNDKKISFAPYMIEDGINNDGVNVAINVVPNGDRNGTTDIKCTGEEQYNIQAVYLPSYILCHYSTAEEAVNDIREHVSITQNPNIAPIHVLVSDKNNSYILEFYDNETHILNASCMSNFYISGTKFNSDGTVNCPTNNQGDNNPVVVNNITPHGEGLERYNIAIQGKDKVNNTSSAMNLLKYLKFSNSYSITNPRISDLHRDANDNLTLNNYDDLVIYEYLINLFAHRDSGAHNEFSVWTTRHSSVYDIKNQSLTICTEENYDKVWTFSL